MKTLFTTTAMMLVAGAALAQTSDSNLGPPPPDSAIHFPFPERARGLDTGLAIEAAQEAIRVCLGNGYKVTALATDSAAVPIVMISGNGAPSITQLVANGKAQSVIKYKTASGAVQAKANGDAAFKAEVAANPLIVSARPGAFPIMAGGEQIGAFAVSGAPGGDKDEVCARAGLAKIQDRIK